MPKPDQRSPEAEAYRNLYKTYRWQKLRKVQLDREPLCRMCQDEGRVTLAKVCDHVNPKSKATEAGFFAGPFQSLCKAHHDGAKQAEERTGKTRAAIGPDGWPIP